MRAPPPRIFALMRAGAARIVCSLWLAALAVTSAKSAGAAPPASLAPVTRADLVAFQNQFELQLRRVQLILEDLQRAQASLSKRLQGIEKRLAAVEAKVETLQSGPKEHFAKAEETAALAKAIRQLEEQRKKDLLTIKASLEALGKVLAAQRSAPSRTRAAKPSKSPASPMKGYEYTVKPGDTLSAIVQAYRREKINVTIDAVLKANPGLDPRRLLPGQKIFIPDPDLK